MMDDKFFDINFIYDVAYGEADEKSTAEFMKHIGECEKCRRAYNDAVMLKNAMKSEAKPSDDFTEKTMKRIKAAKKPTFIKIISSKTFKATVAAAACLVIGIFVFRSGLLGKLDNTADVSDNVYCENTDGVNSSVNADKGDEDYSENSNSETPECEEESFEAETPTAESDSNELPSPKTVIKEISGDEFEENYDDNDSDGTNGILPDESVNTEANEKEFAVTEEESPLVLFCYPEDEPTELPESEIAEEEYIDEPETENSDILTEDPEAEAVENYGGRNGILKPAANVIRFETADDENAQIIFERAMSLAKKDIENGKYSLIVYIPYRDYEELDLFGLNEQLREDVFKYIGSVAYGEYIYDEYEYENDGFTAETYLASCSVSVTPENSSGTQYLIIYQHK